VNLFSYTATLSYPERPLVFDPASLRELIRDRETNEYLVIPLAFVRDGLNEYKRLRYLTAFYQFYFYLEGLYGDGKWRGHEVEERFLKSSHLPEAEQRTLSVLNKPELQWDRNEIELLLRERGHEFSAEGLIKLTVDMRGQLHHYSPHSSRKSGHPLNQREFKSIAYLAMSLCLGSYPLILRDKGPR
jgi:hypothetical protein